MKVDLEKLKQTMQEKNPDMYQRLYGECKCDGLTVMKNNTPYCSKCGKLQVN